MSTIFSPYIITDKVSAFLAGRVFLSIPGKPWNQPLLIGDVVRGFLSEIQASQEIQEACTKIEASLTGSYLANQVVSLHPVVNDKDFKIHFFVQEGVDKSLLYQKVHRIAARYFKSKVIADSSKFSEYSLRDIGVLKDRVTFVKDMMLGSIGLAAETEDLPFEINMLFLNASSLTHLANVDSLEVPLQVFNGDLGSERAGEFILRSKEGEDVGQILSQLEQRVITSSKNDWNPRDVSHFELARYFIWIVDRWTELGTSVFSCFYQGSIEKKGTLKNLWPSLCDIVVDKRSTFPAYPFFLLCNFLFHAPSDQASSSLLEMQDVFDNLLQNVPQCKPLQKVLYTEVEVAKENRGRASTEKVKILKLRPDALFLLSCHLPLLAEAVVCVDHLEKKHLQCSFVNKGKEFAVLVPMPLSEEDLLPWMREIFIANSSGETVWQLLSWAVSSLPQERQKPFVHDLLGHILPHLKKNPSLWAQYKTFLGSENEVQDFMCSLFQREEEKFFEILSLDGETEFIYGILERTFLQLESVSEAFQQKYEEFPKSEKKICNWMLSMLPEGEDRFFGALSFVLAIFPQEKAGTFIRNKLLGQLLSKGCVFSPTFAARYTAHMGSDLEIQNFLVSLLPAEEDFFFQAFSFVYRNLPQEKQKPFAYHLLEQSLFQMDKTTPLWANYKAFLGDDLEIHDWMIGLFSRREDLFIKALSLEKNSVFVCDLLRELLPQLGNASQVFWAKLESVLNEHVTKSKHWAVLGIRSLMEFPFEARCLRILIRNSGIVQDGKLCVKGPQFPKLFPSKEKVWVFALRLAILLGDSTYIVDALRNPMPKENIEEMKRTFPGIEIFKPVFQDLIDKGLIDDAISFLQCQKEAWGLEKTLPWLVLLFRKTKFSRVEILCREAVKEALLQQVNPWRLYSNYASMPSILPIIEPELMSDASELSIEEKQSCLRAILTRIPLLMDLPDWGNASLLASYLPFLGAEESQVASLLVDLFEKSPQLEERQKIVVLMQKLAPLLTRNLIEHFKIPHTTNRGIVPISKSFPMNTWIFTLLDQAQGSQYSSLFAEHLGKFVVISAPETLAIARKYAEHGTEEEKENIALACTQLATSHTAIVQQIFDAVAPSHWKCSWTITSILRVWKFIKSGSISLEKKQQFISKVLERIPNYIESYSLIDEMLPFMDEVSKDRVMQNLSLAVHGILDETQKGLEGTLKGKQRPSLVSVLATPLSSIVQNSLPLYEKLISLASTYMEKLSQKEIQAIATLLERAPENVSSTGQEKRAKVAFLSIQKLRSFASFSWLAKYVSERPRDAELQEKFQKMSFLDPRASTQFLQEMAPQLVSKPKDQAFEQLLQKHIQVASSLDAKTLETCISWFQKDLSSPMGEDSFKMGRELLLLCLRCNQFTLAEDLLLCLYRDLEQVISVEQFQSRYLSFTSEIGKQYPTIIKKEYFQRLSHWISRRNTLLDDPKIIESTNQLLTLAMQMTSTDPKMVQNCLIGLCPSLDASVDSLRKFGLFRKNYLAVIRKLPLRNLKDIDLSFLDPVKPYLLQMQRRFTHKLLLSCASDLVNLYIGADKAGKAKVWIQEWMPPRDASLDDEGEIESFYEHQWTFLCFLAQKHPTLIEESLLITFAQYVQAMERRFSHPLLSQCKIDGVVVCSMLNRQWASKILPLLWPALDASCDGVKELQTLFKDCLAPLLALPSEQRVSLNESFFEPLLAYLLAMKARMPFLEELYICLQSIASFSKQHQYKESVFLDALCPPLDAETSGLEQVSLLQRYYIPVLLAIARDCPSSYIDPVKLQSLVQYTIRMSERFIEEDISKLSRDLVGVCVKCGHLELARSLMEQVHKKRMLQFYQEQMPVNISEDLSRYLEYLIIPEDYSQPRIFSADEFIKILKEHKTRAPTDGVPSFDEIMEVFTKTVQKIHEDGKSTPLLFHIMALTAQFLLQEEPVSERVLRLTNYAFHAPWAEFCFYSFMNLHHTLALKMELQGFTEVTVPGAEYVVPSKDVISKAYQNFHESDFRVVSERLASTVGNFIEFYYALYKSAPNPVTYLFCRKQIVDALQKTIKERPSWVTSCISNILLKYPDALPDFQGFIRDTDVSHVEKERVLSSLIYLNVFSFRRNLYVQGEK